MSSATGRGWGSPPVTRRPRNRRRPSRRRTRTKRTSVAAEHGASPLHQFIVERLVPIQIDGIDLSFTNSALFMAIAVVVTTAFLTLSMSGARLVPSRWQSAAELSYEFIANMIRDNVG